MYGPPRLRGPGQRRGASSAQDFSPQPNECHGGILRCLSQQEHDQVYRIYVRALQSLGVNSPQELEAEMTPRIRTRLKLALKGIDIRLSHYEHFGLVSTRFLYAVHENHQRRGKCLPDHQRHRSIPRETIEALRAIGEGGMRGGGEGGRRGQGHRGSVGPGRGYGNGMGGPVPRESKGGGRGDPYGAYDENGEDDYDEGPMHPGPARGYPGGDHGRMSQPYGGPMAGPYGGHHASYDEDDYDDEY